MDSSQEASVTTASVISMTSAVSDLAEVSITTASVISMTSAFSDLARDAGAGVVVLGSIGAGAGILTGAWATTTRGGAGRILATTALRRLVTTPSTLVRIRAWTRLSNPSAPLTSS